MPLQNSSKVVAQKKLVVENFSNSKRAFNAPPKYFARLVNQNQSKIEKELQLALFITTMYIITITSGIWEHSPAVSLVLTSWVLINAYDYCGVFFTTCLLQINPLTN